LDNIFRIFRYIEKITDLHSSQKQRTSP